MKIKSKLILGLVAICSTMIVLAGCSGNSSPYGKLDENAVLIRYDINGGAFSNNKSIDIVHVLDRSEYTLNSSNEYELKLVEPGSSSLGNGQAISTPSNTGYFLAGWYSERNLRTDDDGNPLDEDGVLTSVSGKPQGYIYSGLWNFESSRLKVPADKTYKTGECAITLYAGWVPNFTYTFVADDNGTEITIGSYSFNPILQSNEIALPSWNENTGALDMGEFSKKDNSTFEGAYSDSEYTQAYSEKVEHLGFYDAEKGISVNANQKVYTTWKAGNWFRIYNASQFYANAMYNGCYEIYADLDFNEYSSDSYNWPLGLSNSNFEGKIIGNGHKFSNIRAVQSDSAKTRGGLFGSITDKGSIENVSFDNVTFTLNGSRLIDASFGLFAGTIDESATLTGVSVSGKLIVNPNFLYIDYNNEIGIFSGNLVTLGVDTSNITCEIGEKTYGDPDEYDLSVDEDGRVALTIKEQ